MARFLHSLPQHRLRIPEARPAAPLLDVVIVLILAAGGLRASEAAGLRLLDYRSGDEPSLRVARQRPQGAHRSLGHRGRRAD